VIRLIYGGQTAYVDLTLRSYEIWWDWEARWRRKVYHRTGALWMFEGADDYARSTLPLVTDPRFRIEELSPDMLARRYPAISPEGIRTGFLEHEAGYLLARQSCELVRESAVAAGAEWRLASARPGPVSGEGLVDVALSTGDRLRADVYVFACGPWLGDLFPDVLRGRLGATRQEVLFFGTPAGDPRYDDRALPVWLNHADRMLYGIPGNERRGFKLADDTRGPPIDPTAADRVVSPDAVDRARGFLARRFPGLSGAPLVEARVCQYEQASDQNFIVDRHPTAPNLWLVGGGSGHGFKMAPAVGELVATLILNGGDPPAGFRLGRFD
jgi:glycine/D-amino acid oxidase-like deaminating enzyme